MASQIPLTEPSFQYGSFFSDQTKHHQRGQNSFPARSRQRNENNRASEHSKNIQRPIRNNPSEPSQPKVKIPRTNETQEVNEPASIMQLVKEMVSLPFSSPLVTLDDIEELGLKITVDLVVDKRQSGSNLKGSEAKEERDKEKEINNLGSEEGQGTLVQKELAAKKGLNDIEKVKGENNTSQASKPYSKQNSLSNNLTDSVKKKSDEKGTSKTTISKERAAVKEREPARSERSHHSKEREKEKEKDKAKEREKEKERDKEREKDKDKEKSKDNSNSQNEREAKRVKRDSRSSGRSDREKEGTTEDKTRNGPIQEKKREKDKLRESGTKLKDSKSNSSRDREKDRRNSSSSNNTTATNSSSAVRTRREDDNKARTDKLYSEDKRKGNECKYSPAADQQQIQSKIENNDNSNNNNNINNVRQNLADKKRKRSTDGDEGISPEAKSDRNSNAKESLAVAPTPSRSSTSSTRTSDKVDNSRSQPAYNRLTSEATQLKHLADTTIKKNKQEALNLYLEAGLKYLECCNSLELEADVKQDGSKHALHMYKRTAKFFEDIAKICAASDKEKLRYSLCSWCMAVALARACNLRKDRMKRMRDDIYLQISQTQTIPTRSPSPLPSGVGLSPSSVTSPPSTTGDGLANPSSTSSSSFKQQQLSFLEDVGDMFKVFDAWQKAEAMGRAFFEQKGHYFPYPLDTFLLGPKPFTNAVADFVRKALQIVGEEDRAAETQGGRI